MTEKRIRVRLDAGNTKSDIKGINSEMTGLGRTADGVQKGFTSLKGVFIAVSAALATGKIAQYSDSWTKLNNQIKQTTDTVVNALAVQEAIVNIAKDSRVELEGVATAYQRISNSVAEYGFSAEDALNVVEGLTKAFKANGTTTQEVSSVLVQLGQGLGAGALQGEELRAVLEASLPVSRAIAKEFGVTTGELKKLGAEGQLTTERVFKALQNSLPEFESAFSKASVTIAEGIQVGENSITRLIGEINTATGAGETLANGLVDLSKSIDFLSDAVASGAAGKIAEVFQSQLSLIGDDVGKTSAYIAQVWNDLGGEIVSDTVSSTLDISDAFLNIIPNVRTLVQTITVEIANAADKLGVYAEAVAATLNPFDDVSVDKARGVFGRQIAELDKVRESALQSIFDQRQAEKTAQAERISEAEALLAKYKEQREARALTLSEIPAGAGGTVGVNSAGKSGEKDDPAGVATKNIDFSGSIDAENALLQQSLDGRLAAYAKYYEDANNLKLSDEERALADQALRQELAIQAENDAFAAELERIANRNATIQDNKSISDAEKLEVDKALLTQKEILEKEHENKLTRIKSDGANQRLQLQQAAFNAEVDSITGFASSSLSLLSSFGKQSFKTQKIFAIADSVVNIAGGVAKALNNPYPANLGFAAQVAAQGAGLLATIKSSEPSSSASSVSVPRASAVSTPSSISSTIAPTAPTQSAQRVFNIELPDSGFVAVDTVSDILKSLAENNEDMQIAISKGQKQAARVGAI
jgi:tape measure domain-containing protein